MADVGQAIQWLRDGRKIRREAWVEGTYTTMDGNGNAVQCSKSIAYEGRPVERISNMWPTQAILANDWTIYEEPRWRVGDIGYIPVTVYSSHYGEPVRVETAEGGYRWIDSKDLLTAEDIAKRSKP